MPDHLESTNVSLDRGEVGSSTAGQACGMLGRAGDKDMCVARRRLGSFNCWCWAEERRRL
ncbi:hypothetical protein B0I35DRAFT_429203 [Stachybotrys elegans]|uniref:Uncharacterized protein n=1 Tax=Stachybotrys elegans TaxID=80388 RepID=A0A8K0SQT6_9HYPO|nr:hypothetical protein B0I35DRAFT_429203 [Stachybotrys elegans]